MADIDLKAKFPDLEPGRAPGALFRVNGIGFGMYGKRDEDAETRTYVKTWCASFLFIPVFALRAFRVADAERGWYFLGRVPLSPIAKACNLLVLAGLLSLGGRTWWEAHKSSSTYRADELVSQAAEAVERGEYAAAVRAWREAVQLHPPVSGRVVEGVRGILDRDMPAADAAQVYGFAVYLQQRPQGSQVAPDLGAKGLALARRCAGKDPRGAVAVADAVAPLVPAEDMAALQRELLEGIVRSDPTDFAAAVRLAAHADAEGDTARCIALLEPHRARLTAASDDPVSESKCARILGRSYAATDRYEDAVAVLAPYVEKRLSQLHAAEKEFQEAAQRAWDTELARLQGGRAPAALDRRIDAAPTEERRQAIVTEHLNATVEADATVRRKREAMRTLGSVVPAALELGHVRLRRAQAMKDPQARQAELQLAEKTFLSIQSFASESDDYRLFLGQVRCWLGRGEEGHALLDELLKARTRSPPALYQVAVAVREIGNETEARALTEEAYGKTGDAAFRKQIAFLRGVTPKDTDDAIEWLGRADTKAPRVRASLAMSRGDRALQDGNEDAATQCYRDALAALADLPESSSTCNETALAWQALYAASGDRSALNNAVAPMERALVLEPASTILRVNAARLFIECAARDVLGDTIDIEAARLRAGFAMLSYLYRDEASRRPVMDRMLAHPRCRDAVTHLATAVLMAPENVGALTSLVTVHVVARDRPALESIAQRMEGKRFDLGSIKESALKAYRGEEVKGARGNTERAIRVLRSHMDACRAKGDATRALAAATLAGLLLDAPDVGIETDLDEAVRLAEEAHAASPSAGTRIVCTRAFLQRALRDVTAAHPDAAERIGIASRELGSPSVFALVLQDGGAPAQAALASKDGQRGIDLVAEGARAFPLSPDGWEWAILSASRPDAAAEVTKGITADRVSPLYERILLGITPYHAEASYDAYWRHVALGDVAGGRTILDRCVAEGTPLPMPAK